MLCLPHRHLRALLSSPFVPCPEARTLPLHPALCPPSQYQSPVLPVLIIPDITPKADPKLHCGNIIQDRSLVTLSEGPIAFEVYR